MASVIRVKRRMGEDPVETLLLSCKRLRRSNETQVTSESGSTIESVLSFAGTISSKSEPVSSHIKEAIKQRKLHKELHPSTADFKHSPGKPSLTSRVRSQKAQASHNSRYRVLSGKRALDLTELDEDSDDEESVSESSSVKKPSLSTESNVETGDLTKDFQVSSDDKENSPVNSHVLPEGQNTEKTPGQCSETQTAKDDSTKASGEKKEFCIFDIEQDIPRSDPFFGVSQKSASGITVNNVPMVCRKAEPEPTDDSQFVYDLYYTHSSLVDLDLQAALTVEALCGTALVPEGCDDEEGGFVHEDSDDSNDEGNWRNDYPDEDPHFFENEDYDYAEDMVDTGYLNDDDTDLLAYWMGSRCNVESCSDNDEDEYEADGSSPLED